MEGTVLAHKLHHEPVQLVTLRQALQEREADFSDAVVPASQLKLDAETGERLLVQNGHIEAHMLQEQAMSLIATRLRIPGDYLKRCPPELRATNVNHWLARLGNRPLLVRFDRKEVRAVLTTRYVPVSNFAVIDRLLDVTRDLSLPVKFEMTARRFVAQLVTNRKGIQLRPNDVVQGGVTIVNSEVGFSALSLTGYLLRLICTNGMTTSEDLALRRIHTTERDKALDVLAEALHKAQLHSPLTANRLRATLDQRVQDPQVAMERINRRYRLTEEEREAVKRAWPDESGDTMFHVINAYTHAGNDPALDLESRTNLQRVGGYLLDDKKLDEVLAA